MDTKELLSGIDTKDLMQELRDRTAVLVLIGKFQAEGGKTARIGFCHGDLDTVLGMLESEACRIRLHIAGNAQQISPDDVIK